jgi:hypothetical protein
MKFPRVKLLNTVVVGKPGKKMMFFGHEFEIQPDGSAVAEIHPDFVEGEVAAGRVEVIRDYMEEENETPEEIVKERPQASALSQFSLNPGNYFGTGSLRKLKKQISALTKPLIIEFADTRLQISLPQSMGKAKMITEVMTTAENMCSQDGE